MPPTPARPKRRMLRRAAAATLVAVAVAGGATLLTSTNAPRTASASEELVKNPTFDKGLDNWGTNHDYVKLTQSSTAKQGSNSALVQTTKDNVDVILNDMPNTVPSSAKGAKLQVSAYVKTDDPRLNGQVRVREVHPDGKVDTFAKSFYLTTKEWTKVEYSFTTTAAGDSLDLSVVGFSLKTGQRLYVDSISMLGDAPVTGPSAAPSPTSAPTETPKTSNTALAMSDGNALSTRGVPTAGALVGAAVGSNADPAPFEAEVGQRLGVHRTYWGATTVPNAVRTAKNDLAAGRLPWLSFRLPYSWEQMAAGDGDAWAKDIAVKLSELKGPVWVAFYHEPETHGDVQQWKAMQERLGPIVRSTAPNVGFTIILTGYHQISGEQEYTLDALWPNTKVDVAGFDIYNFYKTTNKNGTTITKPSDLRGVYFEPISKFVASKGAAWGLAETGFNDAAAEDLPNLMKETYAAMIDNKGVAFSYFNSGLNSSSSWAISTPAKMTQFKGLVSGSPMFPKIAS